MQEGLALVLGYDRTASLIAAALESGPQINVIQGPPGVGKSYLARGIGELWRERGGTVVVAESERLQVDTPYFALNFTLSSLVGDWRTIAAELSEVASAGERALGTGGVISATVRMLAAVRPSRRRARKLYLGQAEQKILADLEALAKKQPLLLVADALHWWDEKSLELLGRLREPRLCESFPFLQKLRILAAQTVEPYESTAHPLARDSLLSKGEARFHSLEKPSEQRFEDVLVALGAPREIAASEAAVAYRLTGGHLALAARCAQRMKSGPLAGPAGLDGKDVFVERLLSDRVQALGSMGASALAVLQIAAVLGYRFRRAEVACAHGGESGEVSKLLRDCRKEELIELWDDTGRFAHEVFRDHFLGLGTLDVVNIHESVSECLRMFRPGDYVLRCRHARAAESGKDAATYAVQAALARQRAGLPWRELPPFVLDVMEESGMTEVVETFATALAHSNDSRIPDCLHALNRLPRNLSPILRAEAAHLRAASLMSTRSEDDREEALISLRALNHLLTEEPELGIRLAHLELYALTLVVDKTGGRELEERLNQALSRLAEFDQMAEDAQYILARSAGSLHEPDVSIDDIEDAVSHFGPVAGQTVIRRPVEYYRCLVNQGAKLLTLARYKQARDVYTVLEELVSDYVEGTFPRLDYPRAAAVLVEYRLGAIDAIEAATRQREIAERDGVPGDPFYTDNALAVYLTLSGSRAEARQIFSRLEEELAARSRPAPSMSYLLQANHCAARYVAGDTRLAAQEWTELNELVERIPYVIRKYLIPRHQLLGEVMLRGESTSAAEFDRCLLSRSRFGALWDQLGRGFRMPEVEWWS